MKVQYLEFPKIEDNRGNLSFVEGGRQIPFDIARAYWIYDVPGGEKHGGHAYYHQEECLIALSGSFDIRVKTGHSEEMYSLNRSYKALYLPAGTWRSLENFSTNALCLVLSSGRFLPEEYIRKESVFEDYTNKLLQPPEVLSVKQEAIIYAPQKISPCSVNDCRLIEMDTYHDREGNITAVNAGMETDFPIHRVYYTYDIPYGTQRGGHAHKHLKSWIMAAASCFEVVVDDGVQTKTFRLDRPNLALEIPAGLWRSLRSFASGAVVLVLASDYFEEEDYIRDYESFKAYRNSCQK